MEMPVRSPNISAYARLLIWAMLGSFLGSGGSGIKRAVGQCSKTIDHPVACVVNQFNGALLAWFKSNSGARCQIQAHAVCGCSVKAKTRIGFCKVIVRAHLNGALACILNYQGASASAHIEWVLTFVDKEFAGCHEMTFKFE